MTNRLPINLGDAMTMLKVWLLPDDDLPLHQSHLIVTFGQPISGELRCKRMQEHFERMTSLEGWSFYCPDHCIVEGGYDGQIYDAVYSSSDMKLFDVILCQLRAIENEKGFECENNLPFTSLVTLDMQCLANNHIVKKK
jgi:hypothetical protein